MGMERRQNTEIEKLKGVDGMPFLEERVEILERAIEQLTQDVGFWKAKATDKFLSINEAAQLLDCSDQTIRNKIKSGHIYCTTKSGDPRIPISQFYSDQEFYQEAKKAKMKKAIFG